jgi:hypothetical protein
MSTPSMQFHFILNMAHFQLQDLMDHSISGRFYFILYLDSRCRDKDSKHRLKGCGPGGVGGTISCTSFSGSGQIFAYSVSYDWSKVYNLFIVCF